MNIPAVFGHEGSGIVEAVGKNVKDIEAGDHVVISYGVCGECENCLKGKPSYCTEFNKINFEGISRDGTSRLSKNGENLAMFFGQSSFATYSVCDSSNLVKVDKDVDIALLGPLGCGIQTGAGTVLNRLKPEFDSTIVIYGCGSVGLSAVMAAKIANCSKIIAVDITESRLNLAMELGATNIINSKECEDVTAEIKKITNGGSHYAVETTGVPDIVNTSLYALRPRGTVAIVGFAGNVTIDIQNALMSEGKTMVGVVEGDSVAKIFIPN